MSDEESDFSFEEEEQQQQEFKTSYDVFSRVEYEPQVSELPKSRLERATMDPLEKFKFYVNSISVDLLLSETDIKILLEKSVLLKYVNKINPSAYVLGFIASNGGTKLTKNSFNNVIKNQLPKIKDDTVLPPDVLRYTRLWLIQLK